MAMKQKTLHANHREEVIVCLNEMEKESFFPTFAFVFVLDRSLSFDIVKPFYEREIEVFGACSAELILNEGKSDFGLVALLIEIPRNYFNLKVFPANEDSLALGSRIANYALNCFQKPSLMLLVAFRELSFEPEKMIEGILARNQTLKIFGGIASSFGNVENPPFFTKDGLETHGVCALIIDDEKIQIDGLAVSGWQEIGTPKKVTKSDGRKVFEIEGVPATDFYARYFGIQSKEYGIRKNHIDPDLLAASEYPLLLRKEDGSEVMRVAIQMDSEERSVSYGGEIPEDSFVRFCSPNTLETIQRSYSEILKFRDEILDSSPDFILMFNCAVRSRSLGAYMNTELNAIYKLWKRNVIGFSSWGEIGNVKQSKCGLHNTVISIVAVKEVSQDRSSHKKSQNDELIEFPTEPPRKLLNYDELVKEVEQLRRDKRILGHFLRLTSEDLEQEETKSTKLLLNILPQEIATRLKSGEVNISQRIHSASVLFADLVGFTNFASKTDPVELVILLNEIFTKFDELAIESKIEKIKTIGDAYMVAAGVPNSMPDHADRCVALAKQMILFIKDFSEKKGINFKIRIGINSGEVTAGVIGKHKFTYDLWGDTVNIAQRMESSGNSNSIQITQNTFDLISDQNDFMPRWIDAKGVGRMKAYLLDLNESK